MHEALATAIDEIDIALDRDSLRGLFALRDRLDARLATAVGDYDAAELWDLDGHTSMTGWLKAEAGCDATTAGRVAARGRKLRHLPVTAAAFADGRLSAGQIDIILAHIKAGNLDRFASTEDILVPALIGRDIASTTSTMSRWRQLAEALDDRPPKDEPDSQVFLSKTIANRGELRGSLDADLHAAVDAALRLADCGDLTMAPAERRADALGTVARFFLDHQQTRRGGRHRPHLNVAMTYEEFCKGIGGTYLDTGGPVSPAELGVLRCDSVLHRLVVSGVSAILDYGRATRLWPADVYNAIFARDRGCRWPGCDRPAAWTDVHHLHEWEEGGTTSVENGCMLCRRHHRKLHAKKGWRAKLLPDGTLEVTHPDGRVEHSEPRGPIPQQFWRAGGG